MKITDNNSNSSNDKSKTPKKPGREPQEGAPSINGFKMAKRNGKLFKSLRKKTKKIIDAQFTMVMIFENVSSDPAFYQKGTLTPLYITCSPYEAAEACIRLFYIKCYPYYKLWCEKYQVPMGPVGGIRTHPWGGTHTVGLIDIRGKTGTGTEGIALRELDTDVHVEVAQGTFLGSKVVRHAEGEVIDEGYQVYRVILVLVFHLHIIT